MLNDSLKYRAFISYSHSDDGWAKWLHKSLERFQFDNDLIGRATALGPVPTRLAPIFRDREEFVGGSTLGEATITAVDQSAAMIVLCSRNSAKSFYVNEEIRIFSLRHPSRPLIPVFIEATPSEALPRALCFEICADGSISDRPRVLLGADLREAADGRALGFAKVVAGLTGLGTDEIFRRTQRELRQAQTKKFRVLLLATVLFAALSIWSELNRREAVHQREIAEQRRQEAQSNFVLARSTADGLVSDIASGLRDVEGLRTATVTKILDTARRTFEKLTSAAPNSVELQRSRIYMLHQFWLTYLETGNLSAAEESAQAALTLAEENLKMHPEDKHWNKSASSSLMALGDVITARGELDDGVEKYMAAAKIFAKLYRLNPTDGGAINSLAIANNKIAFTLAKQGHYSQALKRHLVALQAYEHLVGESRDNREWQRGLSVTHSKIGEAYMRLNNFSAAHNSFQAAIGLVEIFVRLSPDNTQWQRDLAVLNDQLGSIFAEQGSMSEALMRYRNSLSIRKRLVALDPGRSYWKRDVCAAHNNVGDILMRTGEFAAALEHFREALQIGQDLVRLDPTDANFQYDLVQSLKRHGLVRERLEEWESAISIYRSGAEIAQKLLEKAADNSDARSELTWFSERLAVVNRAIVNK